VIKINIKIIKILFVCLLIFSFIIFSSKDAKELEDRNFLVMIGIDINKINNKIIVTAFCPDYDYFDSSQSKISNRYIKKSTGKNFNEAIKNYSAITKKNNYFGYVQTVFLSNDIYQDKKIYKKLIRDLDKENLLNQNCKLVVCNNSAKTIKKQLANFAF
jgi:hypothetical protein